MQLPTPSRPQTAKSSRYKIKNWKEYNQALKERGSIEIWMNKQMEQEWKYAGPSQRGAQYQYSDRCIEMAVVLRSVYHLKYRQLQGFLGSVVRQLGWSVQVPDYSVINRRVRRLDIDILTKVHNKTEKLYIVIDSTGLKVYSEGEWKVRQHGWGKHRTWQKLHVAVDESTGLIESCIMTTNSVDDAAMVEPLLNDIEAKVGKMAGDGAYDKTKVYELLDKRRVKAIIPPRKNARIKKHGNKKGRPLTRDKNIRGVRKHGRKKWKQKVKYHRRSLAETTMYRYKTIFGGHLSARTIEHQIVEARIKCKILNKMTQLGKPESYKMKNVA